MKPNSRRNSLYLIITLGTKNDADIWSRVNIKPLKEYVVCYKGIENRGYLVQYSQGAIKLSRTYGQHIVLVLTMLAQGKQQASLLSLRYFPDETLLTGEFKNVGAKQPDSDAWVYDISSGQYRGIYDNTSENKGAL